MVNQDFIALLYLSMYNQGNLALVVRKWGQQYDGTKLRSSSAKLQANALYMLD